MTGEDWNLVKIWGLSVVTVISCALMLRFMIEAMI